MRALIPIRCVTLIAWMAAVGVVGEARVRAEGVWHGTVPKDWPAGTAAPVVVALPEGVTAERVYVGELSIDGRDEPVSVVGQLEAADEAGGTAGRVWFLFEGRVSDRGKAVTLRLRAAGEPGEPAYRSRSDGPQLHVTGREGGAVLSFWHGSPKEGLSYPMTSFIHPLVGLDGEVLTAFMPEDHLHHRGVFWSWVRHEIEGKSAGDWWQPRGIHLEAGPLESADGPVMTHFASEHVWVQDEGGEAPAGRFVEEHVVCRVFSAAREGRAIDVDVSLRALRADVRIGGTLAKDKGYGGMTARLSQAADVRIENNRGYMEEDGVGIRAWWADWVGVFAGRDRKPLKHRSGVALFVHPAHPDGPPKYLTRYYGAVNVSYPGLEMLEVPRDKPLHLRYRLWVHRGDVEEGRVGDQYAAYAGDWNWTAAQASEAR